MFFEVMSWSTYGYAYVDLGVMVALFQGVNSFTLHLHSFSVHAVIVIGTRPQIIKSALIIKEAVRRGLELDVVHTGQHYDYELSRVLLNELELPDPVAGLEL
jgi:hypothetical protein